MDIRIDEMTSNVRSTDSRALIDPAILNRIVAAVITRMREENDREARTNRERRLTPSSGSGESTARTSR